jgi:hypothetical protein
METENLGVSCRSFNTRATSSRENRHKATSLLYTQLRNILTPLIAPCFLLRVVVKVCAGVKCSP